MKSLLIVVFILAIEYHVTAQQMAIAVASRTDSAVIFDVGSNKIMNKIATGKKPQDIVVTPDGHFAFILNMGTGSNPGNTVTKVDLLQNLKTSQISLGEYTQPHWCQLSKNAKSLWIACAPQQAIVELDLDTEKVKNVWKTGQAGSYMFAASHDDKKIFAANFDAGTVTVINRENGTIKQLAIGGKPIGIEVSPDDSEVWVCTMGNDQVTIIDKNSDHILAQFGCEGKNPTRLKFTNSGRNVVVVNSISGNLAIFDAAERKLVQRIDVPGNFPKGLAVSPYNQIALVSLLGSDKIMKIDLRTSTVVDSIQTGRGPEGVAFILKRDTSNH